MYWFASRLNLAVAVVAVIVAAVGRPCLAAEPADGDVVLINDERHEARVRVGEMEHVIAPGESVVLRPPRLPMNLEIWSGSETAGWRRSFIARPGRYDLRYSSGFWSVTPSSTLRAPSSSRSTSQEDQPQQSERTAPPIYGRATGSFPQVIQRNGQYYRRVPGGWVRVRDWEKYLWGKAQLYLMMKDQQDREWTRRLMEMGEMDRKTRQEIEQRAKASQRLSPDDARRLEAALDAVENADAETVRRWGSLTTEDLDRWKKLLGDQISGAQWQAIESLLKVSEPGGNQAGANAASRNRDAGSGRFVGKNLQHWTPRVEDLNSGAAGADQTYPFPK